MHPSWFSIFIGKSCTLYMIFNCCSEVVHPHTIFNWCSEVIPSHAFFNSEVMHPYKVFQLVSKLPHFFN